MAHESVLLHGDALDYESECMAWAQTTGENIYIYELLEYAHAIKHAQKYITPPPSFPLLSCKVQVSDNNE